MSPMQMPRSAPSLSRINCEHPQVVVRLVGHRGELDDVGIERRQPGVDAPAGRPASCENRAG